MRCEAIHCFDRATVQFAIYPDGLDGARILAEISEDALRDVFGASGGGDSLLQACNNYFTAIGAKALDVYRGVRDEIRRFGDDESGGFAAQVTFVGAGSVPNKGYGDIGIGSGRMPGFTNMMTAP